MPRDPATDGPGPGSALLLDAGPRSRDWRRYAALRRYGDPDSTRWQLAAPAPPAAAASLPLGPRSAPLPTQSTARFRPFWSSWFLWVSTQRTGRSPGPGALPPPRRAPRPSLLLTRSHAFAETAPPRLALPPSLGVLPPPLLQGCEKGSGDSNFSAQTSVRPQGTG